MVFVLSIFGQWRCNSTDRSRLQLEIDIRMTGGEGRDERGEGREEGGARREERGARRGEE